MTKLAPAKEGKRKPAGNQKQAFKKHKENEPTIGQGWPGCPKQCLLLWGENPYGGACVAQEAK